MRNLFDKLPRKDIEKVRAELKGLFKTNTIELARSLKNRIVDHYSAQYERGLNEYKKVLKMVSNIVILKK